MFIDEAIKDVEIKDEEVEQEIIKQVIPKHIEVKKKGHPVKRRTAVVLVASLIAMAVVFSSASLLSYFGRIEANIDVTPMLLIDGESGTIIQESFSAMAGTTVNKTHTLQNLNENISVIVNFSVVSCDEGLEMQFWKAYEPYNQIFWSLTIEPLTTYDVNFTYIIHPLADPNEDLSSVVEIIYLEEPGGP